MNTVPICSEAAEAMLMAREAYRAGFIEWAIRLDEIAAGLLLDAADLVVKDEELRELAKQ